MLLVPACNQGVSDLLSLVRQNSSNKRDLGLMLLESLMDSGVVSVLELVKEIDHDRSPGKLLNWLAWLAWFGWLVGLVWMA